MGVLDRIEQMAAGERYTTADVRRAVMNPRRAISELNRLYNQRKAGRRYNPGGIDVFAEDWDNLVILDACRHDEFVQRSSLPGRTERRLSRGSTSSEFVRGNFTDRTLHDVVYVSANGWYANLEDEIDTSVHRFEFVERDAMDGLTSRPETVAAAAREAIEAHPDKRLVVHFMQPHQPYLGPLGDRFDFSGDMIDTIRHSDVDREDVLRAYRENLDLVLETVGPLLDDLGGKTVVTADHGELLGERERPLPIRTYGHPEGVYVEELVTIPWHVHHDGNRRETVAARPTENGTDVDSERVEQNLRDLGYRT